MRTVSLVSAALAGFLGSQAIAQQRVPATRMVRPGQRKPVSQEELVRRRSTKLAEPWLRKAAWTTDYDEARRRAKAEGKLIFTYFTRSYSP